MPRVQTDQPEKRAHRAYLSCEAIQFVLPEHAHGSIVRMCPVACLILWHADCIVSRQPICACSPLLLLVLTLAARMFVSFEDDAMTWGFLIDMDGVLYRGSELIHGADGFIRRLRREGIPFCLLTNNSQRTRRDVVAKLARLGVEVEESHVFTSAMATARFLAQQRPGG